MLIISHTDVNHTDTGNSPQNTQTYMKTVEEEKKKKVLFVQKRRSLSYAPSDDRCVTACVTRRREGAPEFK